MSDKPPNLDSLFEAALQIESADERAVFLDQSCGNNRELRSQIEQLLHSDEHAGSFLNRPAADVDATFTGQSHGDLAASMGAGFALTFRTNEAVDRGDAGHSVLKSLGRTVDNLPQVVLRESVAEGAEPILRPTSPEMPRSNSDSRYQLQGEIARGGMGAILKGRDTDLGRDLAIKVLLDQHKDKPEVIQRFVEEAQIGGQLQHPGIAPIYELGQFADKRPFFAMKLVKGETLSKLLKEREDPTEDRGRFVGIFEQVCQTMAYAHSRGVIHRDLKPANIMVGAFGEVQVMDWGLAKVLTAGGIEDEKRAHSKHKDVSIIQTMRSMAGSDTPGKFGTVGSQTQMGSVMGTPAYMSPEQALGEIDHLDERADVFGLGAILCEILTGKPPYVADDGTRVFRMASRGKLEDCFQRLTTCGADEDLVALTTQCLELEPVDRPRDAGVLAERVAGYLESVEAKLRAAEVERAAQAARADAEAAQAAAERQRAEAESERAEAQSAKARAESARAEAESARANEEGKRRRTSLALAASVLLLVGLGSGGWLYMERQEANRQTTEANAQRKHAAEMDLQRQVAIEAQRTAEQDRVVAVEAKRVAEDAKEQGYRLLYATDMQLVAALLEDKEASAREILSRLNAHDPDSSDNVTDGQDRRGFEWHYFKRLIDSRSTIFEGFEHEIVATAVTREGELVTLDRDARLQRLDVQTRQALQPPLDLSRGRVVGATSLSRDGSRVALAIGDEVFLFDATSGEQTLEAISARTRNGLAFSPDGRMLITADTGVAWWDLISGSPIAAGDFNLRTGSGYFGPSSVSADGRTVVVGGQVGRRVVLGRSSGPTLVGGQVFRTPSDSFQVFQLDLEAHSVTHLLDMSRGPSDGKISAVAISPDGRLIAASASYGNGMVRTYDSSSGTLQQETVGLPSIINSIVFNPEGTQMATAGEDGTIKVWDNYRELKNAVVTNLTGHAKRIGFLGFVPDGKRMVSVSQDKTVRVWNLQQTQLSLEQNVPASVGFRGRFSPDGMVMVVSDLKSDQLRLRDAVTGEVIAELPRPQDGLRSYGVAFSPNNRLLAVGFDSQIELWDIDLRERLAVLPGSRTTPFDATLLQHVMSLAFSPDGKYLVAGFGFLLGTGNRGNCPLWVYDVGARKLVRRLEGPRNVCVSVTFSPDGSRMASACLDGTARIWDTATWDELQALNNPDEAARGGRRVYDVAFSPDGTLLAMASAEGNVFVWDAETGAKLQTLRGHANSVICVAFSPNGRTLASGADDETVRLWNTATWREMITLTYDRGPQSLTYSPNGDRLLATTVHRDAVIWSIDSDGTAAVPTPQQLTTLLASDADFQNRIRMLSENLRLHEGLAKLPPAELGHAPVQAALAATRANWHASQQRWAEAVTEFERLRKESPVNPAAWLRSPGLIRMSRAMLEEGKPTAAKDLLAASIDQLTGDGMVTENYLMSDPGIAEQLVAMRTEADQRLAENFEDQVMRQVRAEILGLLGNLPGQIADYTAVIDAISQRPENETSPELARLYRRRGNAFLKQEQWQAAVDDYAQIVTESTTDEALLADQALALAGGKNWQRAIAAYSRIITPETTDAAMLSKRAAAYVATEQWDLAKADWLRVIRLQPDQLLQALRVFHQAEQWSTAAEFGQRLCEQTPDDSLVWLSVAPLLVLAEDTEAYGAFCNRIAMQFGETTHDQKATHCVKACLLQPGAIELARLPVDAFVKALDDGTTPELWRHFRWGLRGLVALRSGDAELTVKYIGQGQEQEQNEFSAAFNQSVLAMAQHELGQPDDARAALAEASQLITRLNEDPANTGHHDLLIAEILYREAEAKINGSGQPPRANADK